MIRIGRSWWIMGCMALLLQACGGGPAEPTNSPQTEGDAVLPNIVVQVEGQVLLRRVGWEDFLPAGFGTVVGPGDMLQVPDGAQAAVFCGDEGLWDEGPQALPGDGEEHGVPCQAGRPPRPWPDVAALRGEDDSGQAYVIRPRGSALLSATPALRWNEPSAEESYEISLIAILSDDGLERPPLEGSGGEMAWPSDWPPLEKGATYVLLVGEDSTADADSYTGSGFWLLPEEKAQQVQALEARLRERPLSQTAQDLLVAELYLNHNLRADAMQLLEGVLRESPSAVAWIAAGGIYLELGLGNEAQQAYENALLMAEKDGQLQSVAQAHVGLGLAEQLREQGDLAQEQFNLAKALFEEIGDQQGAQTVEALLSP